MRKVRREELLDWMTYDERRDALRPQVLAHKEIRRIHVGPHFTFLFESPTTVRYQVQEMMRTERIVKEADIQHELDTYNELLGGDGELGATLLIEIDDAAERAAKLAAWRGLTGRIYALLDDATRTFATFDPRQVGDDRLSAVQYIKLATRGSVPTAIGIDFEGYRHEEALSDATRAALRADLVD
jgi:hypothetical protein